MSYNQQLRKKLLSNIIVVSAIIGISLIFTGIKLYQLFATNLLDVQSVMILKDYLPLLITGYGLLALIVSVLTYFTFDRYYPQHQVLLFCFTGMVFMPFTIVLFVVGIMKYLEKSKFKVHFFGASLFGMIVFGVLIASVLTPIAKIEPIYLNEHIIESEFVINDDNYVELKVTGLIRGDVLEKIMFDAIISFDQPNLDLVGTEFVQISMNMKRTCVIYAFDEAQDQYNLTCEISDWNAQPNQLYTASDFLDFEDFYLEFGNVDYDRIMNITITGGMQITNQETIENVYDKYYTTD